MREAFSLWELNRLVRQTLNQQLEESYWIHAELSEVRVAYQGHCYLELIQKEEHSQQLVAKARGVIWNTHYRLLKSYFERETGQAFQAGIKVLICVQVDFHELYGYTLRITDIDPAYTLGDMMRRRQEIIRQLKEEGVLEDNKLLSLPVLPNRIAVISSATAAGYEDFCNQLLNNEHGFRFKVRLFPAVMQGEKVEQSVLAALDRILEERDDWDVVVIIRGGGATSDLSGFDTYMLASSCAQFPLPIITGIGHERDDTVLDLVAHTRVKTPTAAAAFLLQNVLQTAVRLEEVQQRITQAVSGSVEREKMRLERIISRLPIAFGEIRFRQEQIIDRIFHGLCKEMQLQIQKNLHQLNLFETQLQLKPASRLEQERNRLAALEKHFQLLDPELLLQRGYSVTYCGGKVLRRADEVQPGDELVTHLAQGKIKSTVIPSK